MPEPRIHATQHVSCLAAEVVIAANRVAAPGPGCDDALRAVEQGLRILAEALHALGFRFHANGTAAYENCTGMRLPDGPEGEICVAAAEFIASVLPIVDGGAHAPAAELRRAMENSFLGLRESLAVGGYVTPFAAAAAPWSAA